MAEELRIDKTHLSYLYIQHSTGRLAMIVFYTDFMDFIWHALWGLVRGIVVRGVCMVYMWYMVRVWYVDYIWYVDGAW